MKTALRLAVSAIGAGMMALAVPSAAAAVTRNPGSATGVEIFATPTEGSFVGTTGGTLPGSWGTTVEHTPLHPDGVVTGGRFNLATTVNGAPEVITGAVTGGSVTRLNRTAACTTQYYRVELIITRLGAGGSGTGTGSFRGTLTHHRGSVHGYCMTIGATISGSLTVSR